MAVFALLPMPWMGWHAYADYARITSGVVSFYGAQNHDISFLAMFRKNGVPMSMAGLMAMGLAAVGCAAWLIGSTREPSSKASLDLEYSLFLVLTVLFSPIAWAHYLVILVLPPFVLGDRAFRSEPDWAGMFGVVCVALVFAVPIDTYVLPDVVRKISRLSHVRVSSIPTIAQIVLAVWTARVIWKNRPAVSARSRPAQGAVPATPAY